MAGKKKLQIALLGGRILGYQTLSILDKYRKYIDVKIVIAHKKDGEKNSDWNPQILPLAKKLGFPTFRPKTLKDDKAIKLFENSHLDVILNPFCNRIVPKKILESARFGTINFHYGKLPKYKGRFIVSHMILNAEKQACITAHFMEEAVDSGDIIFEKYVPIYKTDTAKSLYFRCTEAATELFEKTLIRLIQGKKLSRKPQKGIGKYYPFAEPHNCIVDLNWDKQKIERFIRAVTFPPISYPWIELDNKKFIIKQDG